MEGRLAPLVKQRLVEKHGYENTRIEIDRVEFKAIRHSLMKKASMNLSVSRCTLPRQRLSRIKLMIRGKRRFGDCRWHAIA